MTWPTGPTHCRLDCPAIVCQDPSPQHHHPSQTCPPPLAPPPPAFNLSTLLPSSSPPPMNSTHHHPLSRTSRSLRQNCEHHFPLAPLSPRPDQSVAFSTCVRASSNYWSTRRPRASTLPASHGYSQVSRGSGAEGTPRTHRGIFFFFFFFFGGGGGKLTCELIPQNTFLTRFFFFFFFLGGGGGFFPEPSINGAETRQY